MTETPSSSADSPRNDEPKRGSKHGGWPVALGFGWLGVALVNVAFISAWSEAPTWATRLGHHGYDIGHFLALGGASAALGAAFVSVANRWRRGWLFALLGLAVVVTVLGVFALEDDLGGFVARQEDAGSRLPWRAIGTLAMTGFVLASVLCAHLLSRPKLRWVSLALGVACAAANNLLLPMHYAGIHLFVSIVAATLIAGCVRDLTLPERVAQTWRKPWVRPATVTVLAIWGVLSLVVVPNARLWRELYVLPGSSLVPFLARLHQDAETEAGPPRGVHGASALWYQSRSNVPPVPPSGALKPEAGAPIVVLITIDAMRADLLNNPEHAKKLPVLSRLRKRALEFTVARSPSPSTATTFTALATGKYYSGTRWKARRDKVSSKGEWHWPNSDKTPRLADLLTRAGVQTVNVRMLNMLSRATGVARGYQEELTVGHYAKASRGTKVLLDRLQKQGPEPLFAAVHFIDAHAPYDRGGKKGPPFDRYLAELEQVDRALGPLLKGLEQPELARRTFVIISADHGEAFGEHHTSFHAATLYDELIRVPMLIKGPGIAPRRVDTPVSVIDLGPTVLDVFGQPTPGYHLGQSLAPLIAGQRALLTRPIAAEAGRLMRSIVYPDGYKAIVDQRRRTEEVYDLRNDPKETRNLAGTSERAESAIGDLKLFFRAHALPNYDPPWRQF